MTCEQAKEAYATQRVMGYYGDAKALYEHALVCPLKRWHHALSTTLWALAERRRDEVAAREEWQRSGLKDDEDGHRTGCSCNSCLGLQEATG